jgi:hypothetical protein
VVGEALPVRLGKRRQSLGHGSGQQRVLTADSDAELLFGAEISRHAQIGEGLLPDVP